MTAPDFAGRLEDYLDWARHNFRNSPLFCARHWAPCPVERKPGLLMTIILTTELLGIAPVDATHSTTALNSWSANRVTPLCCELGDDKIDWLWAELDQPHCSARPPVGHQMQNGRVCWKRPDHEGLHEWDEPASVFALMPAPGGGS